MLLKVFATRHSLRTDKVKEIYTFSKEEEANNFIVEWANHNSENEFKNAYDALEWFRLQDAEVDYTIQLFETKIKG